MAESEKPPPKKRNFMTLDEKLKVIQAVDGGMSYRQIAKQFDIAHSSVSAILKKRRKLQQFVKEHGSTNRKRVLGIMRFGKVDTLAWQFFKKCRARQTPISGVILRAKAKEIAEFLGISDFGASNGWLESFRQRHNISFKNLAGEASITGKRGVIPQEPLDEILRDVLRSANDMQSDSEPEMEHGAHELPTAVETDSYKDIQHCLRRIEHFVGVRGWKGGELVDALKTLLAKEHLKRPEQSAVRKKRMASALTTGLPP